jgi:hypothetical protein
VLGVTDGVLVIDGVTVGVTLLVGDGVGVTVSPPVSDIVVLPQVTCKLYVYVSPTW